MKLIRRFNAWRHRLYIERLRERFFVATVCGDIPMAHLYGELLTAARTRKLDVTTVEIRPL